MVAGKHYREMVSGKHYREIKDQVADTCSNLHEQTPPKVFLQHNGQTICILNSYSAIVF